MRLFITALACLLSVSITAQEQVITYPYNPDADSDSLIAVPDALSFLSLYGNEFIPEPVMVDGVVITEWLESSSNFCCDSLSSVIDSMQVVLESIESNIGGGGCDFIFPEKSNIIPLHHTFLNGDYTVPTGKHLYILKSSDWDGYVDGIDGYYVPTLSMPTIFNGGQILYTNSNNNASIAGYLVTENIEITPLHHTFLNGDYTVPTGKHLYILKSSDWDGYVAGIDGYYVPTLSMPTIFNGGQILYTNSNNNASIAGYLVDEDYFADCGGGGGSSEGVGDAESVTVVSFPDDDETPNDIEIESYSRYIIVDGPVNPGNIFLPDNLDSIYNFSKITVINRTPVSMDYHLINNGNAYEVNISSGEGAEFQIIDGELYYID